MVDRLMNEPLSAAELEADAVASYYAAIQAIGERVKAGEHIHACLRSRQSDEP